MSRGRCGSGSREAGAALVIGLVLLALLTVVAVAGMSTSTLELRMASGHQSAVNAFQAAENAVQTAMHCRLPDAGELVTEADCRTAATSGNEAYGFVLERSDPVATGVLPEGVSLGGELAAVPFTVDATATTPRGGEIRITQGFYVIAPRD